MHLPKGLKDRILTDQRLSLHQKFVLFTLYYLDAKGKLNQYRSYVPRFLNLGDEDLSNSLHELARHRYLRFYNETLSLNVRPLRYNHCSSG